MGQEKNTLNADGFHHLRYSDRQERSKEEQVLKFTLLPLGLQVLKSAGTLQEYRKLLAPAGETGRRGRDEAHGMVGLRCHLHQARYKGAGDCAQGRRRAASLLERHAVFRLWPDGALAGQRVLGRDICCLCFQATQRGNCPGGVHRESPGCISCTAAFHAAIWL